MKQRLHAENMDKNNYINDRRNLQENTSDPYINKRGTGL